MPLALFMEISSGFAKRLAGRCISSLFIHVGEIPSPDLGPAHGYKLVWALRYPSSGMMGQRKDVAGADFQHRVKLGKTLQ